MSYRHIVLFRIRDGVTEAQIEGAQQALRALAALPEVIEWRVEQSLDRRKGIILVEDATFADRGRFGSFRARPEHESVAAMMSTISDWWTGDYEA